MEVEVHSADGRQHRDLERDQLKAEKSLTTHPNPNAEGNARWIERLRANPTLAPGLPR
jgi:hypothetical protein